MAKMTMEFDTETKALTAAIDGVPVPDCRMVEAYPSWDEPAKFCCSFVAVTEAADELLLRGSRGDRRRKGV